MVVVCGGIGAGNARRGAEAVIQLFRPELLVSAGFAGALQADWSAGRVFVPRIVLDGRDGSRTDTGVGDGMLVSFSAVADASQKRKLWEAYNAQAVDMEAAAVARGAEVHGVRFMAYKAISDARDFSMPDVSDFIGTDGRFQTARFAFRVAVRPWSWKNTIQLSRNTALAASKLCAGLPALPDMADDPAGLEPDTVMKS